MDNKQRKAMLARKQAGAEYRNKLRELNRLTREGQTIPAVLIERITALEERIPLHKRYKER